MKNTNCFKCNRKIKRLKNYPNNYDGGIIVHFHLFYGSRYAVIPTEGHPLNYIKKSIICDDCFQKMELDEE
jgi:hypothetical protein